MQYYKLIACSISLMLIGACGQSTGTGASAGAAQGVTVSDGDAMARAKQLQASRGTTANVSFPAASVIIGAFQADAAAAGAKITKLPAFNFDVSDEEVHTLARNIVVAVGLPNAGWPINPLDDTAQRRLYIRQVQACVEFTDILLTEIAVKIATATWRDPSDARQAVLAAWRDMPVKTIRAVAAQAKQNASAGGVTVDLASGRGIHWSSPAGDYTGDGSGWVVTKNGAPWYGGGALSGRVVNISLASSINASATKSGSNSTGSDSKTNVEAAGSVRVQ